jgi:hypothetical protein
MEAAVATGILTASIEDDLSKSSLAIVVHGVHTPHVAILSNNPVIDRGAAQHNQNFSTRIVAWTSFPPRDHRRNGHDQKEDARTKREYCFESKAISLRQQAVNHQHILGAYIHLAIGDCRYIKVEGPS